MNKPSVLFVCVHNAGRSQMAAAFLTHLAGDKVEVRSAGSAPADSINPAVVEALKEVGIDISNEQPKVLTTSAVEQSDVVIAMGCSFEISMPTSFSASTTSGLIELAGAEPADLTSTLSPARCVKNAAAI